MSLHRPAGRWTIALAAIGLVAAVALGGTAQALAQTTGHELLGSTPLILKDGRIANVSVHVFPFRRGTSQLTGARADELARLTRRMATDCFLTAQVIGHVGPEEVADSDTLSAHRLARSRADSLQASLIGGGLPATAIASVWDWQFMVREPRATLWLFQLVRGEDCEGRPLDPDASMPVAEAEPARPAPSEPTPEPTSPPRETAAASPSAPASDDAPATTAEPAREPDPAPRQQAVPAGPAPKSAEVPRVTKRVPAASVDEPATEPAEPEPAEPEVAQPEPEPAEPEVAEPEPARAESAEVEAAPAEPEAETPAPRHTAASDAGDGSAAAESESDAETAARPTDRPATDRVAITFANNSSYFPPGTRDRLQALIDQLSGGNFRIRLEVSVSGSTEVVGASSKDEALRYNQWLAERRRDRVLEWLRARVDTSEVEIDAAFLEDNNSRQVVVELTPVTSS